MNIMINIILLVTLLLPSANLKISPVAQVWRSGSDFSVIHHGIDVGGDERVYSVTSGQLVSGNDAWAGNYAVINTPDGGCQLFAHLDSVIGSGYVTPHTLIGRMGNTGIGSHGLHLHWEIRKKGGCERSTSGIFVIRIATNETELNKYWVNPHDYNPNYFRNHHIWDIE